MARAVVLTDWGAPDVLREREVEVPAPGPGQILLDVRFAGVGPTDLAIRAGRLKGAFGSAPGSVLGFEAAGVVAATGDGVTDVRPGDPVAAFLPELGGYAERALARYWVPRPDGVDEQAAAALPASGEAAVRVVDEVAIERGDRVLVIGAAGSVGLIATQLAVARGAQVFAAARPGEADRLETLGAIPVPFDHGLVEAVRAHGTGVDAVIDVAGRGSLPAAVELAGGPQRVITLSDPHAAEYGVRLSGPDGPHIAERLRTVMRLLEQGALQLRARTVYPLSDAAVAHRDLESSALNSKVLLAVGH